MGICALIFDFNGVLVDDEAIHFALFQEVLAQEGVAITERDYHERYLGYDDRGCIEAALVDGGRLADRARVGRLILQKAERYVQVAEHGLRYFPEAAETVQKMASRGPVAICSGALRPEIEFALKRLGQLNRIAVIVSAEDTQRGKPDPECYRLTLTALQARTCNNHHGPATASPNFQANLEAANCLVIEDSLAGIVAAKGAGMRVVGIPNTYAMHELHEAGADDVIDGLGNLTSEWIEHRFGC